MFGSGQTEKKGETGEEQSQEHAHNFFFTSKGLFTKNSSSEAKQSISHTTVTFHGDCVKMCEDFDSNFDNIITGCCITTTHCLTLLYFTREFFFTENNMTVVPTRSTFLVQPLKIKLRGRHFDTIETT
jgi:hypothetical protein